MLVDTTKNKDLNEFLTDMREFEREMKYVPDKYIIGRGPRATDWVNYIVEKHVDLNSSSYEYIDQFVNILKKNKIRWTLIAFFTTDLMVRLEFMDDKKLFGGRVRLCEHMITHR